MINTEWTHSTQREPEANTPIYVIGQGKPIATVAGLIEMVNYWWCDRIPAPPFPTAESLKYERRAKC